MRNSRRDVNKQVFTFVSFATYNLVKGLLDLVKREDARRVGLLPVVEAHDRLGQHALHLAANQKEGSWE